MRTTYQLFRQINFIRLVGMIMLFLLTIPLSAQTAHGTCGTFLAKAPETNNPDSLVSDRFGNRYSIDQLSLINALAIGNCFEQEGSLFNFSQIGNLPTNEQLIVCAVGDYLSDHITRREGIDCAPFDNANIIVAWADFSNPNDPIWDDMSIDEVNIPDSEDLIAATAIYASRDFHAYSDIQTGECNSFIHSNLERKINGAYIEDRDQIDGIVLINSNPTITSSGCSSVTYNTDLITPAGSCELDLYTIVLHGMMHILGLNSLVGINTLAFDADPSHWDRLISYTNNGASGIPMLTLVTGSSYCFEYDESTLLAAYTEDCDLDVDEHLSIGQDFIALVGDVNYSGPDWESALDDGALNNLSHFRRNTACNNPTDLVLFEDFPIAESRRLISDEEYTILCDIGYSIIDNNNKTCVDDCIFIPGLVGSPGQTSAIGDFLNFYSECSPSFTICEEVENKSISIDEILSTTTNSDNLIITDFTLVGGGLQGFVTVTPNAGFTQFDINVSQGYPGILPRFGIQFFIESCSGEYTNSVVVMFELVRGCDLDCTSEYENNPCDNISCFTNFDSLTSYTPIDFTQVGQSNYMLSEELVTIATVDVFDPIGNGNQLIGLSGFETGVEPLLLPLSFPVDPGCSIIFNFDAAGFVDTDMRIWGSEGALCTSSELLASISPDMPGVTDCGGHVFTPTDLGTIMLGQYFTQLPYSFSQTNPPLVSHSVTLTNPVNSGESWNYLTIFPEYPSAGNFQSYFFIDNVSVFNDCELSLVVNEIPTVVNCVGSQSTLSFEVCNGNREATIDPILTLPSGFTIVNSPVFPQTIDPNTCESYTYFIESLTSMPLGSYNADVSITVIDICDDTLQVDYTLEIIVDDCLSPCEPLADLVIGDNECSILLSELITGCGSGDMMPSGTYANGVLIIYGELIIDTDYTFSNCEIIMAPGSALRVGKLPGGADPTPTLNVVNVNQNGGIHGCDTLWRGISVFDQGRLILDNSTVRDAFYAIEGLEKGFAEVAQSRLYDNYIGMHIPFNEIDRVFDLDQFWGNHIAGVNGLLPGYNGQPENAGNNARFGIDISGSLANNDETAFYKIGVRNSTPPINPGETFINTFENLAVGVISQSANISISETRFLDMLISQEYPFPTGYGVFHSGDNLVGVPGELLEMRGLGVDPMAPFPPPAAQPSFNNCESGAIFSSSSSVLLDNIIVEGSKMGFHLEGYGDFPITVTGSTIRNAELGIFLSNPGVFSNMVEISNNLISVTSPQSGIEYRGIMVIDGLTVMSDGSPFTAFNRIVNNDIVFNNAPGIGLDVLMTSKYEFADNDITYSQMTDDFIGMRFAEGGHNRLSNNKIKGDGPSFGTGIEFFNTGGGYYLCSNTVKDLHTGLDVMGINSKFIDLFETSLRGDFTTGIRYGEFVTNMNAQELRGNSWHPNSSYLGNALQHDLATGLADAFTFQDQRFQVTSDFPPSVDIPNYGILEEGDWYLPSNLTDNTCSLFEGLAEFDDEVAITVGNLDGQSGQDQSQNWLVQAQLWDYRENRGAVLPPTIEAIYKNSIPSYDKDHAFLEGARVNPYVSVLNARSQLTGLREDYTAELGVLHIVDSLRSIGFQPSPDRDEVIKELTSITESMIPIQKNILHAETSIGSQVLSNYEFLENSNELHQTYLAFLNLLNLRFLDSQVGCCDELTLKTLDEIASLCPKDYPRLVSMAQAWLLSTNPFINLPTPDCSSSRPSIEASSLSKEERKSETLEVYPNPTGGNVTIRLSSISSEGGNLKCFDALGRCIEHRTVNPRSGDSYTVLSLDIDNEGVYIIQYTPAIENGRTLQQRVIVQN